MKKVFLLLFLTYLLVSCQMGSKHTNVLVFDSTSSLVEDARFPLDSITVEYRDSIYLYKHYPQRYFETCFTQMSDGVYETRNTYDDLGVECLGADIILTLSLKDTSFIYKSTIDYISTVWDYSYADSRYEIKKSDDGNYITTKQSLIDSTYKEIYYYDKEYRITKFINTYKGNRCIYILKK